MSLSPNFQMLEDVMGLGLLGRFHAPGDVQLEESAFGFVDINSETPIS